MDVQGQDKARILMALYNKSGFTAPIAIATGQARPDLTYERAQEIIEARGSNLYFDYLHGRVIKVDIGRDFLDFRLYDRDNGAGAGERAVLSELTAP